MIGLIFYIFLGVLLHGLYYQTGTHSDKFTEHTIKHVKLMQELLRKGKYT